MMEEVVVVVVGGLVLSGEAMESDVSQPGS